MATVACLVIGVTAPTALGATKFRPRVANAMGLTPAVNLQPDLPAGELQTPVTYHGGAVMSGGVTVHTIFWTGANGGNPFSPSPNAGASVPDYIGMVQQFFTDMDTGSTGTLAGGANDCTNTTNQCSVFTTLPQWGFETNVDQATGSGPPVAHPGANTINYSATGGATNPTPNLAVTGDSIVDHDPYPAQSQQCASPQQQAICITDQEVQNEVNSVVGAVGGTRGLHDLWYVFLPDGVDECITPGICGTNFFGGYHSLSNVGNGVTIYAVTIDPAIETRNVFEQGKDPNGNPDAELTVDIAAHETEEAMTDPEGVGYLDPNGFEIGDKCENGPPLGRILGSAGPDNGVYNQIIGTSNHKYLLQEMWVTPMRPVRMGPLPACRRRSRLPRRICRCRRSI